MKIEDNIQDTKIEVVKTFEIKAIFKMITPKDDGYDEYNLDEFLSDSMHLAAALEAGKAEFSHFAFKVIEK